MRLSLAAHRNKRASRGDTIVEVLIAIAIVSSVLAGAFSVTQRSSQAVRDSEERAEMLQVLQGQVELVRGLALGDATSTPTSIFNNPTRYFCVNPQSKQTVPYNARITALPPAGGPTPPGPCSNISNFYNVGITYNSAQNTFTFVGWWAALGGGTNHMQLSYRISPFAAAP